MLNEFQPTKKARCECGAVLWDGDDTRYPIWIGGDPYCLHQGLSPDDNMDDPELAEIGAEMDEIIERINKSTQKINKLKPYKFPELEKHDAKTQ